jgi:hydroxyacylglutathione hydrolase
MEIIEGIHRVDEASNNVAHSNVYLVIDGKDLVVIDTGMGGNAKKIVKYIEKIGYQSSDVSTIVLTHYHMDHAGSAKDLKKLTNAKVAAGAEDADIVSGKKPFPKAKTFLLRAVSTLNKPASIEVEISLKEGDKIGTLTVIETPGHTPGSIALFDEQKKAMFVGDTLRFNGTKISAAPEQFTWDAEKENQSIEKISKRDFDVMLPGHGEVLMANASGDVKEFLGAVKNT